MNLYVLNFHKSYTGPDLKPLPTLYIKAKILSTSLSFILQIRKLNPGKVNLLVKVIQAHVRKHSQDLNPLLSG